MSVLNTKPFIQTLIESLSTVEKKSLLNVINGAGSTPRYSLVLRDLSVSTSIERCLLETKTHLYNAYKIYKSNKITFLTYGVGQEMGIYQVDYPYYEKELKGRIRESLSVDELRRYLEEPGSEIDSGEINSGTATEGQVLMADGEGGAEWGNLSSIFDSPEALAQAFDVPIDVDDRWHESSVKKFPMDDSDTLSESAFKEYLDYALAIAKRGYIKFNQYEILSLIGFDVSNYGDYVIYKFAYGQLIDTLDGFGEQYTMSLNTQNRSVSGHFLEL